MNPTNFRFEIDADGIALATWDMPGRSMNVFTDAVMDELSQVVDGVVADPSIKGCVIVSGKDNFSGGADLTMLQGLGRAFETLKAERGEEEAMRHFFEESRKLSLVFRKLETCGKPFAAAVNGICLGGAFELALSCHYRVLSDDPKTRVGLPEIKVGLFPGGGGTQRVARLMQTGDALQMLFKGEQIRPLMARNMGLAHEVAAKDEIVAKATGFFGATTEGLAKAIEKVFAAQGRPNAYIAGHEASGAIGIGSAPISLSFFLMSGSLSALTIAPFKRSTIAFGVAAAANMPYHACSL